MNKKILEEVDKVISDIKESETYKNYLFLKDKLKKNEKANSLIIDIKKLQKEIVKKEVLKQETIELEKELSKKLELLNRIPLYIEFLEIQEDLNAKYQLLKQELDDYFSNVLN